MRDPRSALVKIEGADLDSSVRLEAGSLEGEGKVRIARVNLADAFFVRDVSAPLRASGGTLTLAPLRATLATGFAFPMLPNDNRVFDWEYQLQLNYFFGASRPRSARWAPNF